MAWYYSFDGSQFTKSEYSPKSLDTKGHVLIKPLIVGICGSDLHRIKHGIQNASIGHEWVGKVITSTSPNFSEGNIVTSTAHIPCGECDACKNNQRVKCADKKLLGGTPETSVLSESILLPEDVLIKLEDQNISKGNLRKYSLLEVAFIGDLGIKEALRIGMKKEDTIMVFGAGSVGMFTAWGLKLRGYNPIIVDPKKERLDQAKALDIETKALNELVILGDYYNKIDTVIDCSGDAHGPGGLPLLPMVASRFGKVVIVGKYKDKEMNQMLYANKSLTVTWLANHPYTEFLKSLEFWKPKIDLIPENFQNFYSIIDINKAFDEAIDLKGLKSSLILDDSLL